MKKKDLASKISENFDYEAKGRYENLIKLYWSYSTLINDHSVSKIMQLLSAQFSWYEYKKPALWLAFLI